MKHAFALALCTLAGSLAGAQTISYAADGNGEILRNGARLLVNRATVSMLSSGRATVTLRGSKTWSYIGNWRRVGTDNYQINILEAYGDPSASGTITVGANGDRLEVLRFDGRAANLNFEGSFRATGAGTGAGSGSGSASFEFTTTGEGTWRFGQTNNSIPQATVDFNRDGRFQIRIRNGNIDGTYRELGNSRYQLTVREILGRTATGSGTLALDGSRSIRDLELRGTADRSNFSLDFKTRAAVNEISLNKSHTGDGTQVVGRQTNEVEFTNVLLRRDGTFELEVRTNRGRETLAGTFESKGDTVRLQIDRAFDLRDVTGSGTIELTRARNDFKSIRLTGRGGSTAFRVAFDAKLSNTGGGNPDPRPPVKPPVNTGVSFITSVMGTGTYRLAPDDFRVENVRAELRPDGNFMIAVKQGQAEQIFNGTYTMSGNNAVLTITRGYGGIITGNGTLTLDSSKSTFQSVRMSGRWGNRAFSLDFARR